MYNQKLGVPIYVCYAIGYIKEFIPELLSSQRFHADERF